MQVAGIEIPPLRLSDVMRFATDGTLDKAVGGDWGAIIAVVHAAAVRADPSITPERIADTLDLSNVADAVGAFMGRPQKPKAEDTK